MWPLRLESFTGSLKMLLSQLWQLIYFLKDNERMCMKGQFLWRKHQWQTEFVCSEKLLQHTENKLSFSIINSFICISVYFGPHLRFFSVKLLGFCMFGFTFSVYFFFFFWSAGNNFIGTKKLFPSLQITDHHHHHHHLPPFLHVTCACNTFWVTASFCSCFINVHLCKRVNVRN